MEKFNLIPVMQIPEKIPVVRVGRKVFIRREVLEKIEMEGLEAVSGNIA